VADVRLDQPGEAHGAGPCLRGHQPAVGAHRRLAARPRRAVRRGRPAADPGMEPPALDPRWQAR
jgi:hypothetical protein